MDNLLPLVLAHFYPNYIHKETALSVLGSRQSPVKWIYNVWCIISGVCPLNENRQDEDIITKIHGGSSAIGFMALLIVPLLLALLQLQISEFFIGTISLLFFVAAFVFFCFFIMGEKEKFSNTVLQYGGLWQRLVLISCYVPLFTWCILN